jgi:hypothetical protein
MRRFSRGAALLLALAFVPGCVLAQAIGKIKVVAGEVTVERAGKPIPAALGAPVYQSDRITTGRNGSVGVLLDDDSRLSLGPNSSIALDKFEFDLATDDGSADVSISKGTLSVVSGKLVKKTPGALKVRTPAAILAVRGTEFSVKVDEPGAGERAR